MKIGAGRKRISITTIILVILDILAIGFLAFLIISRIIVANTVIDISDFESTTDRMPSFQAEDYLLSEIENAPNSATKLNAQIVYVKTLSKQGKYSEATKYSENINDGLMDDQQKNVYYWELSSAYLGLGDPINAVKYELQMPNPPKGGGA